MKNTTPSGDAHLRHAQTIRPIGRFDHFADRIGQHRHFFERDGNLLDAGRRQFQPIHFRTAQPEARRGREIEFVRRDDLVCITAKPRGRLAKPAILDFAAQPGEFARRGLRAKRQCGNNWRGRFSFRRSTYK